MIAGDKVSLIESTSTHDYYQGSLGPISVPKMTRRCTVCGKLDFWNSDAWSFHAKHGGKLERVA